MKKFFVTALLLLLTQPVRAEASVLFTEIMYNPIGADTGREWVEIYNDGTTTVDLTGWKFGDASSLNHTIFAPNDDKHPGQGSMNIPAGGYAIIADDASDFLLTHTGYVGTVLDTTLSLTNTNGIEISLRSESNGPALAKTAYVPLEGANETGNTLQRTESGAWVASSSTPGAPTNSAVTINSEAVTSSTGGPEAGSAAPLSQTNKTQSIQTGMTAHVLMPSEGTVHIPIEFSSEVFGYSGEYRSGGVFHYAFGDAMADTQEQPGHVFHTYETPGLYIVTFTYKSNRYMAKPEVLVRKNIDISMPGVNIVGVSTDGIIELKNTGPDDVDISFWSIASHADATTPLFVIPEGTSIHSGRSIFLPTYLTKMSDTQLQSINLLFPNGVVATTYTAYLPETVATKEKRNVTASISKNSASEKSLLLPKENLTANVHTAPTTDTSQGLWPFVVGLLGVVGMALYIVRKYTTVPLSVDTASVTTPAEKIADSIRIIE